LPLYNTFQNSTNLWCSKAEEEEQAQLIFIFIEKEWIESSQIFLELITIDGTVKTNVLVFRDNNFFLLICIE
jgi:hypothetical protein